MKEENYKAKTKETKKYSEKFREFYRNKQKAIIPKPSLVRHIKKEDFEYFIPASALEHPANKEFARLKEKLRWACIRFHQTGDFQSLLQVPDPVPRVKIEHKVFNVERLGYDVWGIIEWG